jgi:hypothetical protein
MPSSLRFLLILACLAGLGYAAMWALANYPPKPTVITKPLSNDAFRQ